MALPGVGAVWGLRHRAGGEFLAHRWAGLPLESDDRILAERFAVSGEEATAAFGTLAAHGLTRVLAARFDVAGEASGTILVAVDDRADARFVATCLAQVVEVTREAVRRIAAHRAEQQQQTRDALLAEASLQMDAVLDATQTMHRVARMTVPAIAEGCLVFLSENGRPVLHSGVHVDMRRLSAMLDDPAQTGRLAEFAATAVRDGASRNAGADAQVLRARGRVIGVLVFLFDRDADRIPPAAFLRDVASRAALAIDNSTLYEQRRREVAAMQQHLLPNRLPVVAGLSVAASYTVGDEVLEVGGDFYDVVERGDGAVAALIGDVCGRGVEAAALTGLARHTLAALLAEGISPVRAMSSLNARLHRHGSWRFITAGVALLRPAGDGFRADWTSAGHPAPVVLRRRPPNGPGRGGGVPLGILPRAKLGRSRLSLGPGDTLVLFTDGLTECRDADGRMFEESAFAATLDRLRGAPADLLVKELGQAAAAFGGGQADDAAIVALQVGEN
ncbi:PP2C family protein-serine/threonine phosphatase [Paractinoplanes durhamensis]